MDLEGQWTPEVGVSDLPYESWSQPLLGLLLRVPGDTFPIARGQLFRWHLGGLIGGESLPLFTLASPGLWAPPRS